MQRHRGLAIFECCELLSTRNGNSRVAGYNFFNQFTHSLDSQRQRSDIQEKKISIGFVANQHIGLYAGAHCYHPIWVDACERLTTKERLNSGANERHPCRPADQNHVVDVVKFEPRIAQ